MGFIDGFVQGKSQDSRGREALIEIDALAILQGLESWNLERKYGNMLLLWPNRSLDAFQKDNRRKWSSRQPQRIDFLGEDDYINIVNNYERSESLALQEVYIFRREVNGGLFGTCQWCLLSFARGTNCPLYSSDSRGTRLMHWRA